MTLQQVTVSDMLTQLVAGLTALTLVCGLVGLAVRFVLLPWLQTHIVTPVKETKNQVTVNGHVSATPTLLDRVDTAAGLARDLRRQVDTVVETTDDLAAGQQAMGRMLDGHLDRSAGEWGRLWAAINEVRIAVGLTPAAPNHEGTDTDG